MTTTVHGRQVRRSPLTVSPDEAVAMLAAFTIALRISYKVPIALVVCVALLPVTLSCARRYVGTRALLVVVGIAALSGYVLTAQSLTSGHETTQRLLVFQTIAVLLFALSTLTLLWVRSLVGIGRTGLAFGLGSLAHLGVVGINHDNVWKFSLSVPVTLLCLSMPWICRSVVRQTGALVVLAAISAVNDSRSATATMLIAAALVSTQLAAPRRQRANVVMVAARISLLAIGGYYTVKAATLEGVLGDAARARSEMQIEQSGSLLVGGRPESGAAAALIHDRPLGYGSGVLASPHDVQVGKAGMAHLGYDPHNGYVNNFMFGRGFEVHSLFGDLWIIFGLAGALLGLLMAALCAVGLAHALSHRAALALTVYLSLRLIWDLAFSPLGSAAETLPLALATVLIARPSPRADRAKRRSAGRLVDAGH